jgi:hypothetical protein
MSAWKKAIGSELMRSRSNSVEDRVFNGEKTFCKLTRLKVLARILNFWMHGIKRNILCICVTILLAEITGSEVILKADFP